MMELHFLRPYALWVLLPCILVALLMFIRSRHQNPWLSVVDKHLLSHMTQGSVKRNAGFRVGLVMLAWFVGVFALCGPSWQKLPVPLYQTKQPLMIVFDLSPNMLVKDIVPNRLVRAKFKLSDILRRLKETQVGLVVFSSEPFLVSPLTEDVATIEAMLPQVTEDIMPVGGSDVSKALKMAEKLLKQAGYSKGKILLITASQITPQDKQTVKQIRSAGWSTSVLAVATSQGRPATNKQAYGSSSQTSPLDEQGLQSLAQLGGGLYIPFQNANQDVEAFARHIQVPTSRQQVKSKNESLQWQDQGRYFVLFVLPFVLLAFRKGWLENN